MIYFIEKMIRRDSFMCRVSRSFHHLDVWLLTFSCGFHVSGLCDYPLLEKHMNQDHVVSSCFLMLCSSLVLVQVPVLVPDDQKNSTIPGLYR
jgi:hypothetical protein